MADRAQRARSLVSWAPIYLRHRVLRRAAPRLANARDLADAAPGLTAGVAYRSDAPRARDEPPAGALRWPPATVIDLRAASERAGPHPLAGDARIVSIDVLEAAGLGSEEPVASLAELYARMVSPGVAVGLTRVVDEVAHREPPVLIHCSAGKDRTGLAAALILRLVGADRGPTVADYVLTRRHMPAVLARLLADRRASAGRPPLTAVPRIVLGAPAAAIESVLDVWDGHEGGVEGWYLAHGGDASSLAALRSRLRA